MRILAIRGQNLASLARSFEVDLAHGPLAAVGLFAITGPVGSGKSTLLDALCLPLFDCTPRLRGRGGPLVGDGDDPEAWLRASDPRTLLRRDASEGHAEVDFVGRDGRRYRARWLVRRARRRIDGRIQEQELSLRDLDRDLVIAAGRRSEVLAAIAVRLGLDFEQFCRSVLLAQGDFAAFLQAPPAERARLLEALTGADIYRRLSRQAHERHKVAAAERHKLEAQIDASPPLPPAQRQSLEDEFARLETQREVCRVAIGIASRYVAWHDQAQEHQRREATASQVLQQALAADAAAQGRRVELQRLQRALVVVAHWQLGERTREQAAQAEQAVAAAAADVAQRRANLAAAKAALATGMQALLGVALVEPLPKLVQDPLPWLPLLQQWQVLASARAKAVLELPAQARAKEVVAKKLAVADAALRAAMDQRRLAAEASAAAEAAVDPVHSRQLQALRQQLEDRRQSVQQQRVAVRALQQAEQQLAATAAALRAVVATQEGAARREAASAQDREQATAALARARAAVAQQQTRAGFGALREHLHAGQPCPLCGAGEHPSPAAPDRGELDSARRAERAAEQVAAEHAAVLARAAAERTVAEREHIRLAGELASHEGMLAAAAAAVPGGEAGSAVAVHNLAAADRELSTAVAAVAAAEADVATRTTALQRALQADRSAAAVLQQRQAEQQQAAAALVAAQQAHELLRQEQHEQEARALDLVEALAPACDGIPGGARALLDRGEGQIEMLRALAAERQRSQEAEAALARANEAHLRADHGLQAARREERQQAQELARACADNGVVAADVAAAARAGQAGLAAAAASMQQLADAVTRARAVLHEIADQRREHEQHARPTLDADEAQRAFADARDHARRVEERLDAVRTDLRADDLIRRHRNELMPRLQAATAAHETWAALDELIGSSTGDAFAVFAQGLTLDLLLVEANRRLLELARRYQLVKNHGGDLDFVVVDLDLGGGRRSLQSLSGGETFLVSLALALALASLAAPKARVETLFLDEGFGTLDAQALEVALGALDSLHATGCQVGVISHVEGIAERIGAQVNVVPEGGGRSRVVARA